MLIDFHHHLPLDPPCPYTEVYAEAIEEVAAELGIDYVCRFGGRRSCSDRTA